MAVRDMPGGNSNAEIRAGITERPVKAYQWICTNPGCSNPNQIGRVEDGCAACGAGADAQQGEPLAPTDFNCSACRGSGTVERKCGVCDGTGYTDPPQLGEPPPTCEKCGGSGGVAFTCGRCDGSGIDPQPVQKKDLPEPFFKDAPLAAIKQLVEKRQTPPMPTPSAGIFKLPSIDEDQPVTSPDTVVRYRLIRYEGPRDWAERTIDRSLAGKHTYPIGAAITAIEIAKPKSSSIDAAFHDAEDQRRWPAVDEKY